MAKRKKKSMKRGSGCSCPVIRYYCSPKQETKGTCYVRVGKRKYSTGQSDFTKIRVEQLVSQQKKRRCNPEVKDGHVPGPASPLTVARREMKKKLKLIKQQAREDRKSAMTAYKIMKRSQKGMRGSSQRAWYTQGGGI